MAEEVSVLVVDDESLIRDYLKEILKRMGCLTDEAINGNEAIAKMKSRGIRVIDQFERGKAKVVLFHPKDTYGIMIEFIEYESEHPCVTALKSE